MSTDAQKVDVKVRYTSYINTDEPTWEYYPMNKTEITLDWINSLGAQKMGNDAKFDVFMTDRNGEWTEVNSDIDITMNIAGLCQGLEVKFTLKRTFPGVKWDAAEPALKSLSESTESGSAVAALARGMVKDPAMRTYLDALALQIFGDSALLSEALNDAVVALGGTADIPIEQLLPQKSLPLPTGTKMSNNSDKTIDEILKEMDEYENTHPQPPQQSSSSLHTNLINN